MNTGKHRACVIASAYLGTFLLIAAILAYSQYVTLKQVLLARMAGKVTALIGHKTDIGDISFSPAAGITLHNIRIGNPAGFDQGQLLGIKQIGLAMRYSELFRGRLSFSRIDLSAPELSLRIDHDGRLNISEELKALLTRKGTLHYRIDEVAVTGGRFSFNDDPLTTIKDVSVTLLHLSSEAGTKSALKASMILTGDNRASLLGWALLKDSPITFGLSLSSEEIALLPLKKILAPYGIDPATVTGSLQVTAEGDMERGCTLAADIRMKHAASRIFTNGIQDLSLSADAFFDAAADSVRVNRLILEAGGNPLIRMSGEIHDLLRSPSYRAEVRINKLDLASLHMLQRLNMRGIVNADTIQITGRSFSSAPQISGSITLSEGALYTGEAEILNVQAAAVFRYGNQVSARTQISGTIGKAGPYALRKPVDIEVAATMKGRPDHITLSTAVSLAGTAVDIRGNDAAFNGIEASFDGIVEKNAVSGSASLSVNGPSYGTYQEKELKAILSLSHDAGTTDIRDLQMESTLLHAAADSIIITLLQDKGKTDIKAKNVSISYRDKRAELIGLDCAGSLFSGKDGLAGKATFHARKVMFQDIAAGSITGSASIDDTGFSLTIPSAHIFDGTIRLLTSGRISGGPFPVSLDVRADHIDVEKLSRAVRLLVDTPYRASGNIDDLSFKGKMQALDVITGDASVSGKNITLKQADDRALLKDAVLDADGVFRGRDAEIKAQVAIGGMAASLKGAISRFAGRDRSLHVNLIMPETRASDIRSAFWDVFPDSLLYAGLEGGLSVNVLASYNRDVLAIDGSVLLKDIIIEGENNEYTAGPVDGMVPIHFSSTGEAGPAMMLPSFEQSKFDDLRNTFAGTGRIAGSEVKVKSLRYGFRILEDVSLWLEQNGQVLNINRFSAKMFGGNVYGTARLTLTDGLSYQAGLLLDGASLAHLCEDITPLKGYISGKVSGIAMIKGKNAGLEQMIGKAEFWTFSDREERMSISREFLQKIGGPQIKAYLRERRFDKGVMSLYIQNGFLIFRELEISNRNIFGITDLSVKVAPLSNRIAIDHLMWTITEAAQRAKNE